MTLLTQAPKEVTQPSSCRHRLPTLTRTANRSYTTPRDVTRAAGSITADTAVSLRL